MLEQKEVMDKELYVIEEGRKNSWHLRYPLYYGIYKKALTCILGRIARNKKDEKEEQEKGRNLQNCDNIIAFTGVRGSGKTTAMIHFCLELEENEKKFEQLYKKVGLSQDNVCFHCLEMIELSMLEENEDIFELILAKMLEGAMIRADSSSISGFESASYKELCGRFDKVYRSYNAVKYKKQMEEYGESPLSRLKNLSSSLSVKEEFAKLLELFFEYVYVDKTKNSQDHMLVIPFDDLDLNIEYGYEMLETVYRYMRNPKVIILLAIDQEQMEHICTSHIFNAFNIRRSSRIRMEDVEVHCEELAKDYLNKMIPLDVRVYMPDIEMEFIQVADKIEDEPELELDSQKMFIMKKYARKTGICYDACGRKRHFCEAKTIRTLINYNHFLDSLKDVDIYEFEQENIEETILHFRENYEQIYGDTVNRMASEKLSSENEKLFKNLLKEDISRWGQFVYRLYLKKLDKTEGNSIEDLSLPYCYGDLLKCIYYWGREHENDKPLIHMILALFSLEFTKEFMQYCIGEDEGKHKERLKELQGRSLGGKWVNEGLPLVDVGPRMKLVSYGYIPDVNMKRFRVGQFKLLGDSYTGKGPEDELNEVVFQIREKKVVETLEMISLFFSNVRDSSKKKGEFKYDFTLTTGQYSISSGEEYQVLLQHDVDENMVKADFDIWGVAGSIDVANRMKILRDDIFKKLKIVLKKTYGEELLANTQAEDKLKKLKQDIGERFAFQKGEMAVPYYNLDLTYNIFKRIRQKSLRENPPEIPNEGCVVYAVKMYEMFGEELKDEIKKYGKAGEISNLKTMEKRFSENPYIRVLLDRENNLPSVFDQYMGELIKAIAPLDYSRMEQ